MMNSLSRKVMLSGLVLLAGCVTAPTGPSIMALPGTGKSFEQFRMDDADCRQFALSQAEGTTAAQAGSGSGVRSAAVGTAVGAIAGAAFGGSKGAGIGAGTGLLLGSAGGVEAAQSSSYTVQHRYDNGYIQCMYAKGQKVPISGRYMQDLQDRPQGSGAAPYPPPPPGNPPPPPPGH
jgi:hypothetical protein